MLRKEAAGSSRIELGSVSVETEMERKTSLRAYNCMNLSFSDIL